MNDDEEADDERRDRPEDESETPRTEPEEETDWDEETDPLDPEAGGERTSLADRQAGEDEGGASDRKIEKVVDEGIVEEKITSPEIEVDRPDLPSAPSEVERLPEFPPADRRDKQRDGGFLQKLFGGPGEEDEDETERGPEEGPQGPAGPAPDREGPDRPLVYLPELDEHQEEEALYTIKEDFLYVRIVWDDAIKEHLYQVLEPDLSQNEDRVYEFVKETLVNTLDVEVDEMEEEGIEDYLREKVDEVLYEYSIELPPQSLWKLEYYILRDFLGYGKVDVLMQDPYIEDISCDGPEVPVFIYHRKFESMKTNIVYPDDETLDSFVIKLAQKCGKHISIADPVLDSTMPDGSRLQATLGREITTGGSTFTIRKFREDPFTPTTLIEYGTFNDDIIAYFWLAVQNGKSGIFAGGTASGKSTSLNAILLFIPPQMKIVSIEDTRELNLPHPNWIAGVTREGGAAAGQDAGDIDMYLLLREALRQRPEYIVVGEVRGEEAYTLFQGMATGHTTYSTMHADSVESAIHRLNNEPINVPKIMLKALDFVSIQIQTRVGETRVRRCKEIVEIVGVDPHTDEILTNEVFSWKPSEDAFEFSGVSYVLERIKHEKSMTDQEMQDELKRRKQIIGWMREQDIADYEDVARVVTSYYKDPGTTMARIDEGASFEKVTRSVKRVEDDEDVEEEAEMLSEQVPAPLTPQEGGDGPD